MSKVLKLTTEFEKIVHRADEILVASAMITDFGLSVFDDRQEDAVFKVLVGIDLPTQPSTLQKMLDTDVEVKIYNIKKQFFHPKLYLFRIDEEWIGFVGSGNCTKGGLSGNIEMTLKIEDEDTVLDLADWFDTYYNLGIKLEQEWLDEYSLFYAKRRDKELQLQTIINQFKKDTGISKGKIPLSEYDFNGQFFDFKHYNAFTAPKPILDETGPIAERLEVRNKLETLHELVYPKMIKKGWNVFPHHQSQHLTSSFRHNQYAANSLDAIWLHYGRGEEELELYKDAFGDDMTSLYHMRVEILILKNYLWVELRVGKNDGSYLDREHIRKQLKTNKVFADRYFDFVKDLENKFTITIADEEVSIKEFKDTEELKEFTLKDNPRLYYFRIGREYRPDDKAISEDNIVDTILADFEKLYPLYQLFKHNIYK